MDALSLNVRQKNSRHEARRIRRMGKVPGILYGEAIKNVMFEIGEMDLVREIVKEGEHAVLKISINGEEHQALIKEVQREPVTRKIVHIDLEDINPQTIVQQEIPVIFTHEELVSQMGGILQREKDSVKVQCRVDKLPKYINLDLSKIKLSNVYRISDIEAASEISFVDDRNTVIATITDGNTSDVSTGGVEGDEIPVEIPNKHSK